MRVLAYTSLFPSVAEPHRAGFMPGRLGALARHVDLTAIIPSRAGLAQLLGRPPAPLLPGADFPLQQTTFRAVPGLGRDRRPAALVQGSWPLVERLHQERPFDLVLGHFLYPDGVAAVELAGRLGLPAVVVAHGSDVHQQAVVPARRAQVFVALERAAGLIVVSRPLRRRLLDLGLPAEEALILPCGYDPVVFAPGDRAAARAELHLADARWLVFCGMLRRLKRVDTLLEALVDLPDCRLAIVGGGPEAGRLAAQAHRLEVARRVLWVGPQPHDRVARWLAAADAVVLASESEGTPTVLVEALAVGTPVVATAVGGIPDLVEGLAHLVEPGDAPAFAAAVRATLADPPPAAALRAKVAQLSWPAVGAAEAAFLEHCRQR